jgi:hypothetical protein
MMYGQKSAMALPVSGAGMLFESVWIIFAAITVVFMGVSVFQLVRPTGNYPRP